MKLLFKNVSLLVFVSVIFFQVYFLLIVLNYYFLTNVLAFLCFQNCACFHFVQLACYWLDALSVYLLPTFLQVCFGVGVLLADFRMILFFDYQLPVDSRAHWYFV